MIQFTREEAIAFAKSGAWESLDYRERAILGMEQSLLCMPFGVLHEAVEKTLERPVFTHEFGLNYAGICAELRGEKEAPSLDAILAMIPADKLILVRTEKP